MVTVYRGQMGELLRGLDVHNARAYYWFGALQTPLRLGQAQKLSRTLAKAYVVGHLRGQLYQNFYCTGRPVNERAVNASQRPAGADAEFIERLSAANFGEGCWQGGWRRCIVNDETTVINSQELMLWVGPHEYRAMGAGADYDAVEVLLPKEMLAASNGFYMALGNHVPLASRLAGTVVRLYWNASAAGAVRLMEAVTRRLNARAIPFQFKIVNDPHGFDRCDAAVLYLERRSLPDAVTALRTIHAESRKDLKSDVPAMTKRIAHGVGLAEDPGDGTSFGLHRCGLIAEAAVSAFEKGCRSQDQRMSAIEQRFAEEGLRLESPYLNAGSTDTYDSVVLDGT
jgi:hypothetical protein